MFEIFNPKTGEKGRMHQGDYTDHLPGLRKIAPVTIIQHTPRPDEDGTDSYPVHIAPPAQKAVWRVKIARYCVIALAVALLTTSCGKTAANGKIADIETWQSCDPSEMSDKSDKSETSDPSPDTTIDLTDEWEACYRLAHAFAVVESNDNPKAINHHENAVGPLANQTYYGEAGKSDSRRRHLRTQRPRGQPCLPRNIPHGNVRTQPRIRR